GGPTPFAGGSPTSPFHSADAGASCTHPSMNTSTVTPVALATCVEHSLNLSLSGFDLKRARLYGVNIVDSQGVEDHANGALRISFLAEHGDVYELLEARGSAIARMFDAAAVLTCGWAAPVGDDNGDGNDDDLPPSVHPRRRRVRLLVVVSDAGVGSVLRFADTPDEVVTDPGNAKGSLADAVEQLWRDAIKASVDTTGDGVGESAADDASSAR
ncbi:MAG: hypothetical protein ACO31D_01490, partial [Ilumatobacteraceae bacterium]